MKNKIYVWTITALLIIFSIGCKDNGGTTTTPDTNSINIVSIAPSTAIAGTSTTFSVKVSYNLTSKDIGIIYVGFNSSTQAGVDVDELTSHSQIVNKGSGTITFDSVAITPINWGTTGNFHAYVNLSEYPHSGSWSPLAHDEKVIAVQ